jgi:sugar O-acyltransferase (sialic acid O-acetyltransferase NeuD family)
VKNVLIFGASGHGSVILDCLERSPEFRPVGFVDSFKEKGTKIKGYEVLGTELELREIIDRFHIIGGIIAIGDNWGRQVMAGRIERIVPNFQFISVVHPTACVGKDVHLGKGVALMPGAIVNANSKIGDHCFLNTRASLGHDGVMEPFSSLAPGVSAGGNVSLGRGAAISIGTSVLENIRIGEYSVIGAGSLVLEDIPARVIVFGSPARVVRTRRAGEPYLSGNRPRRSNLQLRFDYTG